MKCPACDSTSTRVLSTRQLEGSVSRARCCDACQHRWLTTEIVSDVYHSLVQIKDMAVGLSQRVLAAGGIRG